MSTWPAGTGGCKRALLHLFCTVVGLYLELHAAQMSYKLHCFLGLDKPVRGEEPNAMLVPHTGCFGHPEALHPSAQRRQHVDARAHAWPDTKGAFLQAIHALLLEGGELEAAATASQHHAAALPLRLGLGPRRIGIINDNDTIRIVFHFGG